MTRHQKDWCQVFGYRVLPSGAASLFYCSLPPYAHRLSPCHIRAPDESEAEDDDSAAVFCSAAGVSCVGGVETGCFVCHDGCEFADDDPIPVFSSGARITHIGVVEAHAFGANVA